MDKDKMETASNFSPLVLGSPDGAGILKRAASYSNSVGNSSKVDLHVDLYQRNTPQFSPTRLKKNNNNNSTQRFVKPQTAPSISRSISSQPKRIPSSRSRPSSRPGSASSRVGKKVFSSNEFNSHGSKRTPIFHFGENDDEGIDEEDDNEDDDEDDDAHVFSTSLPITSFIGIRPAPPKRFNEPPIRHCSSASALLFPSSATPSPLLSPSSAASLSPTISKLNASGNNSMGVLCPTDISPLDKNANLGFEGPASPSVQVQGLECLPRTINDVTSPENIPAEGAATFAVPHSPRRNRGQRFTFEQKGKDNGNNNNNNNIDTKNDAISPSRAYLPSNSFQARDNGNARSNTTRLVIPPRVAEDSDNNSPEPRSTGSRMLARSPGGSMPQFRRQLSKRKSESILDVPPTVKEESLEVDDEEEVEGSELFHSTANGILSDNKPCTPTSPKARRMHNYDPYQVFEVQRTPCVILTVRVLRARNVTNGWRDYVDIPDPYINLYMATSPEGRKSTGVKKNSTDPVWNEEFTFYITFNKTNVLQITLMESNSPLPDFAVGTVIFNVNTSIRDMERLQTETFVFNEETELDIEFHLQFDSDPTLRYSLCLCDAEKEFQERRKGKVLENMRRLLGQEEGPANLNEVPNIAVIGSGGGFRALTGYSGVFKALMESGVLGCTMYAGGLSGSSWLLSTLYSHPKWPNIDMAEFLDELMNSVDKRLVRFLNPSTMFQYMREMVAKRREGQPVSFTDVFGKMVGETLLQGRMDATLTDQRQKLVDGGVPMPLYTCVHVKKDVPARSFQEWVEFSPYEIGLPKYGTFMDSALFGSKFFMGKLVKQFKEQPLHFLQGIWGSAFCILFKRLLEDNRRMDPAEMIRLEIKKKENQEELIRKELGEELDQHDSDSSSDCSDEVDDESEGESLENDSYQPEKSPNSSMDSADSSVSMEEQVVLPTPNMQDGDLSYEAEHEDGNSDDDEDDEDDDELSASAFAFLRNRRCSVQIQKDSKQDTQRELPKESPKESSPIVKGIIYDRANSQRLNESDGLKKSVNWGTLPTREPRQTDRRQAFARANSNFRKSRSGSMSYWKRFMKGMVESEAWDVLSTRRGRAAVIHNFMRGLSLQQSYPLSPFTPVQERVQKGEEFDGIFDMVPTSLKHIYMVDAGLTFNSPYPLVLRPQREVDIILSFDFSARPADKHQPFKELLLAEKWARLNRLPFPPIDLSNFDKNEVKELYIFKDPEDPFCPVVFHFALVNNKFRDYSKPGFPRQTKQEFDFANFDIFDDPSAPYSTFSFTYAHESFKRLSQLTEFNTLLHIDEIKEEMKDTVLRKRQNPNRYDLQQKDIKLLRMNSVQAKRKKHFGVMKHVGSTSHSGSNTPLYTALAWPETPSVNPFFSGFKREYSVTSSGDGSVFGSPEAIDSFDSGPFFHDRGGASPNSTLPFQAGKNGNPDHEKRSILQSAESVYGTPPENNDFLVNSNSNPPLHKAQAMTNSFNSSKSSNSSSSPSSDNSTPKVILASGERKRKESPPNPFFTSFVKSSQSSPLTAPAVLFPNRKGMKTARGYLKKHSPRVLQSPPSQSPTQISPRPKQCEPLKVSISPRVPPFCGESLTIDSASSNQTASSNCSKASSGYFSQKESEDQTDMFSMAPAAFKADGTPVIDGTEAKMYEKSVKEKRKLFRRQSTVSSMNNISLEEPHHNGEFDGKDDWLENGTHTPDPNYNRQCANLEMNDSDMTLANKTSHRDSSLGFMDLSGFEGTDVTNGENCNAVDNIICDKNSVCHTRLRCLADNQGQVSVDSGTDVTFNGS